MRRLAVTVAVALAVAGGASCGGGSSEPSSEPSTAPSSKPARSADCRLVLADRARTPHHVAGTGGRVVVISDSFATGLGMATPTAAWPYRLARRYDWDARFDTLAGSGFVNPGPCGGRTFSDLARIPEGTRLVVVAGGLNDLTEGVDQVRDAAVRLFSRLRRQAGTVVAVSPALVPGAAPSAVREVARVLAGAADDAGVRYVDATKWRVETQADGYHPTASGAGEYADRLARAGVR